MRKAISVSAFAFRVALTLACLAAGTVAGESWLGAETASAQRRCSNTECVGVDRCYYGGNVHCSFTPASCTTSRC